MARVPPTKFAHIVYRTRRFEEMLDWYKTVFFAQVHVQNPVISFLSYDDEHHRFAFINLDVLKGEDAGTEKRQLVGVDHVAYTYSSIDDLLDNYERLKEQGIEPYWCVHHGITASMYYQDPDGNQMEFQVDCFESRDETIDFFKGPDFAANPVGVEYDPEVWLSRRRAGAPLSEFLHIRKDGPVSPIRGALSE